MNKLLILLLIVASASFTSCRNRYQRDVVTETYLHKYGVPVAKEDWSRNGKEGQIIQLKSDGVTVTRSYVNGILNGIVSYTFPNSSTIAKVETYDHGVLKEVVKNFSSGVPRSKETIENGKVIETLSWYEDGTPASLEKCENGLLVSGEYRNPSNVIESKVENGSGVRTLRGIDGELLSKDSISNGQLVERISYFSNGDPSSVTAFEKGLIHGTRVTFFQGGLPKTVEQWVMGKQDGPTIVYQNGEKIAEIPYIQGDKHGIEYRYRDGKVVVEEITWKHGVQHGPRTIIAEDASKTEWYHEGELVSRPTYERMNKR